MIAPSRAVLGLLLLAAIGCHQTRNPIIDVHLHAEGRDTYIATRDSSWWLSRGLGRLASDQELMQQSLDALRRNNVVRAITSEALPNVERWRRQDPERLIPALLCTRCFAPPELDSIRSWVRGRRIAVLGEMAWQYTGRVPSDSALEPFWALAEELDLPVGIHMGLAPPGWSQRVEPKLRITYGRPTTLEAVLVGHPRLRVYVMHAGWPFLDDMLAMLHQYPGLYVDVSWIDWYLPTPEFYRYLRRLVEAGFEDRVMYGSDQMQWPTMMDVAIANLQQAPFLSSAEKGDILCRNAARFFRLQPGLCASP